MPTGIVTGASRGLGLALVRQAVRRRGGYVNVENAGGALFTAFLPHRADPEPAQRELVRR
jgi:signal transduction histidine kinase